MSYQSLQNSEKNRKFLRELSQEGWNSLSVDQKRRAKKLHKDYPELLLLNHLDIGNLRNVRSKITTERVNPIIREQINSQPVLRTINKRIDHISESTKQLDEEILELSEKNEVLEKRQKENDGLVSLLRNEQIHLTELLLKTRSESSIEINLLKDACLEHNRRIDSSEDEINLLKEKLDSIEKKEQESQSERIKLMEEVNRLKERLNQKDEETKALQKRVDDEMKSIKERLNQKDEEIAQLKDQNVALDQTLQFLSKRMEETH